MDMNYQKQFDRIIQSLSNSGGRIMLIGPSDSGKTTTAIKLLSRLQTRFNPIGFLDADIGQSCIGPPGTIGGAVYHGFNPDQDLESQAKSLRFAFIGSFTPMNCELRIISCLNHFFTFFADHKCRTVIIDTTGLIHGRNGLRLKRNKLDFVKPHHILFFTREEKDLLLFNLYSHMRNIIVHRLPASSAIRNRSLEIRRDYRLQRIGHYLHNSNSMVLNLPPFLEWRNDIVLRSTNDSALCKYLHKIMDQTIYFAAIASEQLLVVSDSWMYNHIELVKQKLGLSNIYFIRKQSLKNKLIAIEDTQFNLLTYGILDSIDFNEKKFVITGNKFNPKKAYILKIGMETINFC